MMLSLLIASLQQRAPMLQSLLEDLHTQINILQAADSVEVLVLADKGQKSIGRKRQALLQMAKGEYIAYIDDDDAVPPWYVAELLRGAASGADCMSLQGAITTDGAQPRTFIHALGLVWEEREGIYYRPPNHLNAVKRSLALQAGFRDMAYGEDRDYSERLAALGLLKTQHTITRCMYYYLYRSRK